MCCHQYLYSFRFDKDYFKKHLSQVEIPAPRDMGTDQLRHKFVPEVEWANFTKEMRDKDTQIKLSSEIWNDMNMSWLDMNRYLSYILCTFIETNQKWEIWTINY